MNRFEKMHFTLVFQSHESEDLSISICFVPCICWVKGKDIVLNPHGENPVYKEGDLENFLLFSGFSPVEKNVAIIVHPEGHGTLQDLNLLKKDLSILGFTYQIMQFEK